MSGAKQKVVKRQLFPEKLWELVNRPSSGIQWSPDGKRIEVERSQLEKFNGTKFRSRNFDSFIRQLHFYGFRKTGNSYHNDKFQRGQPEALLTMKRKYSNHPLTPSRKINVNSPCYTASSASIISTDSSNTSTNAVNTSTVNVTGAIDLSGANINSSTIPTLPQTPNSNFNEVDNEFAIDYSSSSSSSVKLKNMSGLCKAPCKSFKHPFTRYHLELCE